MPTPFQRNDKINWTIIATFCSEIAIIFCRLFFSSSRSFASVTARNRTVVQYVRLKSMSNRHESVYLCTVFPDSGPPAYTGDDRSKSRLWKIRSRNYNYNVLNSVGLRVCRTSATRIAVEPNTRIPLTKCSSILWWITMHSSNITFHISFMVVASCYTLKQSYPQNSDEVLVFLRRLFGTRHIAVNRA